MMTPELDDALNRLHAEVEALKSRVALTVEKEMLERQRDWINRLSVLVREALEKRYHPPGPWPDRAEALLDEIDFEATAQVERHNGRMRFILDGRPITAAVNQGEEWVTVEDALVAVTFLLLWDEQGRVGLQWRAQERHSPDRALMNQTKLGEHLQPVLAQFKHQQLTQELRHRIRMTVRLKLEELARKNELRTLLWRAE